MLFSPSVPVTKNALLLGRAFGLLQPYRQSLSQRMAALFVIIAHPGGIRKSMIDLHGQMYAPSSYEIKGIPALSFSISLGKVTAVFPAAQGSQYRADIGHDFAAGLGDFLVNRLADMKLVYHDDGVGIAVFHGNCTQRLGKRFMSDFIIKPLG